MTRDELQALIEVVLDAPRTEPDRLRTIMLAADAYAATWISATVELTAPDAGSKP